MTQRRKSLSTTGRAHDAAGVRDPEAKLGDQAGDIADGYSVMNVDRRGNIVDRRSPLGDRRGRGVDRRGMFADRRQATEARYRAPLDTQLQARLSAWQESERRRVAADLHDAIGSSLCTIRLKLEEQIARTKEGAAQGPTESLAAIVTDVSRAMEEVRRIAMDLRPAILDDLGIIATIGWLGRELVGAQKGIRVDKQLSVAEAEIPAPLKTPIFRIVQEALNNATKHSGAERVRVVLRQDATELRLAIEDDGKGFEIAKVLANLDFSQHYGIANMRQRANSSGGLLMIKSAPGEGTVVSCVWPQLVR
jgi:signal transduction histidine kinase